MFQLTNQLQKLEEKYLKFAENYKFYPLIVAFVIILFSIIHNMVFEIGFFKHFDAFIRSINLGHEHEAYKIIQQQSIDLVKPFQQLHTNIDNPENHYFKMKFRIFLPLFVKILHIHYVSLTIFLFEFVLGFYFIVLLLKFLEKHTNSKINALYFVLILSTLYPISAFWMDFTGYGDALAFFFLLAAIYFENILILCICLISAYFIDERALVNSCFVFLWYFWIKHYIHTPSVNKKVQLSYFNSQLIAVVLSWVIYFSLRMLLGKYLFNNLPQESNFSTEFVNTYYENFKILGLNIWRGFKGSFYLFTLLFILYLYQKRTPPLLLFFLPFLLVFNFSFIAYDISRSMGYSFLAIVSCFLLLNKELGEKELKMNLIVLFFITITCPNFSFMRLPTGYFLY